MRVALPDLDQAWQQVLQGLKVSSTNTSVKSLADDKTVEAGPSRCEQSFVQTADPLGFFGTVGLEVEIPHVAPVTTVTPQSTTKVQTRTLKEDLQGFYTIVSTGKNAQKDGHRRNSRKVHIISTEVTASSFIPYCQSFPFQNASVKMSPADLPGAAWCQRCIKKWEILNHTTKR